MAHLLFAQVVEIEGAKSAEQRAKHIDKLNKARKKLQELERLLENAKMRNTIERLTKEIQEIADKIAGHIKEMKQKWPNWEP